MSVLGIVWLWRDTHDPIGMAAHSRATFWFVLPSLLGSLLIPALMNRGASFWEALAAGCLLTIALYLSMTWVGPHLGLQL